MDHVTYQGNAGGKPLADLLRSWSGTPTERPLCAVVTFAINGWSRFLSHAQLVRVFERACVRLRIPISYSQGFNPHARISLPLPKSVGLAVTEDVLCMRLAQVPIGDPQRTSETYREMLQSELPEGIQLTRWLLVEGKVVLHPQHVTYRLALPASEDRAQCVRQVLAGDTWPMSRPHSKGRGKTVDVRPYIETIQETDDALEVVCSITERGSIRVDEIKQLLAVSDTDMQEAVTRTHVTWLARGQVEA